MTTAKKPTIVQCTLGGKSNPPSLQLKLHDLILDLGSTDIQTLRITLARISERYQITALIPVNGYSLQVNEFNQHVATLASELKLQSFGATAHAIARNRFLSRCHWQRQNLPTPKFSLVQFPSALPLATETIGLPSTLTPLHYALPHLFAHIDRRNAIPKAHRLVSQVMCRHCLSHSATDRAEGCDPRTGHSIRFSLGTDMLLSANEGGSHWSMTLKICNGKMDILTCVPAARRSPLLKALKKSELQDLAELSMRACAVLGVETGFATCLVTHGIDGDVMDGIMPNFVDPRLIAAIEEKCRRPWAEVVFETYTLSSRV